MTNYYDAGGINVTIRLDSSGVQRDLYSINKSLDALQTHAEKSGKSSGTAFWNGFSISAKQAESGLIKGFLAGGKATSSGGNYGKGFAAGFKAETSYLGEDLSGSLGKALGGAAKGGLIGLALDGLAYGIGLVADAAARAKERQEAFNARIKSYRDLIASSDQFLAGFNGIFRENIDLVELAENRVNKATGEYENLLDVLNKLSDQTLDPVVTDVGTQKTKILKDLKTAEDAQHRAQTLLDHITDPYNFNPPALNYGSYVKDLEEAKANVVELNDDLEDVNANLKKAAEIRARLRQANEEKFFADKELFNIDLARQNAEASGDSEYADDLRDLSEIIRLTEQFKQLDIAKGEEEGFARQIVEQRRADILARDLSRKRDRDAAEQRRQRDQEEARAARESELLKEKKLQNAKRLMEEAQLPIEKFEAQLNALAEMQQDTVFADVGVSDDTFGFHRIKALTELANSTVNYESALEQLIDLQQKGLVSAEQFGQAFRDLTGPIEWTGDALERLHGLSSQGLLGAGAITAANNAITRSSDYADDLDEDRKKDLQLAVVDIEKEAARLEKDLILAELSKEEDTVDELERRLAVIAETIKQLNVGVDPAQAAVNAEEFVKQDEAFDEEKKLAKLQGDVKDVFKDGIKAAIEGDFEEFLAGKLQGAADEMFDKAIDTLLDSLLSKDGLLSGLLGGGGEGGAGGLFGGLAEIFAGFFADGGVVPKGQFAIVGERGPEVISAGASPLRVTPMNDNIGVSHAARLAPDGGGGARAMQYAPINNFYGHTQDDLRRSLDARDRALKTEMPGMMDRHSFNRKRGMA